MCSKCGKLVCNPQKLKAGGKVNKEDAPSSCPMKTQQDILEGALEQYKKDDIKEFARQASIQEAECYQWVEGGVRTITPRVEEVIQFSRKMNYKKLGIAFCIGLWREANILTKILENKGFELVSVCCKTGAVPKEELGLSQDQKIRPGAYESMCNPIAQAEIINHEEVDLAILVGLCVGHDTLFVQHCRRPLTILVVKDRVFGHNPVMGLYLSQSLYYGRLLSKEEKR
jgi:uncharacterized metal-binding protein